MKKLCITCKKEKELIDFNFMTRFYTKTNGQRQKYRDPRSYCKSCMLVMDKKRARNGYFRHYAKKYRANTTNLDKIVARKIFHSAIKNGEVKRKDSCEICGSLQKIEGHHTDYKKPLMVQWLCKKCHYQADKLLK